MSLTRTNVFVLGSALVLGGCVASGKLPAPGSRSTSHLDAHGDLLPQGAAVRLGTTRWRLARPIRALAFSPDSRRIAVAGEDDVVVWSVPSGEEVARLHGHSDETTAVAFSEDGTEVVSASEDGTLRTWDLATRTETSRVEAPLGAAAVLSPDARWATFFGPWAWPGEKVRVLDARTGRVEAAIRGSDASHVAAATFVPGSRKLALVTHMGEADVFSFDGRVERDEPVEHLAFPRYCVAAVRGAWAVGAFSHDLGAAVFPMAYREPLEDLEDAPRIHSRASIERPPARAVALSPDGRSLALGASTLVVADALSGRIRREIARFGGEIEGLAYSPDGKILAVAAGRDVELFSAATLEPLVARHRRRVTDLAFSPDGRLVATSSLDGTVRFWEAKSGEAVACVDERESLTSVAFSPDGRTLYAGDERGQVHVIDVASGSKRGSFDDHSGGQAIAVSPDGQRLASAGRGTLAVFSTRTGLLERPEWLLDADRVGFLGDGKLAVGVLRDLKLVSLETGDGVWPLSSHERGALAFAPGDEALAVSVDETSVVVRDLASDDVRATLAGGHTTRITSLAWSPSSATIASASDDGHVVLWDVFAGEKIRAFTVENHEREHQRMRVVFSPDGSRLAVFGEENAPLLIDVGF